MAKHVILGISLLVVLGYLGHVLSGPLGIYSTLITIPIGIVVGTWWGKKFCKLQHSSEDSWRD